MSHHRPSKKARSVAAVTLLVAAATAVAGCVEPRAPSDADLIDVTWVDDVAPLLAERCVACHSGAEASADYRLDAYCEPALPSYEICAGVLGPGSDETPNVVVGEGALESRLLAVFEGDGAVAVQHREALAGGEGDAVYADRLRLLERWVATDAPYFLSSIHPAEILDPRQPGFHGRDIAAADWRMDSCRSCHGDDYRGGAVGVSCTSCHRSSAAGPEACDTCHGTGSLGTPPPGLDPADPAGPHAQHLVDAADRFVAVTCEECHTVPARFEDDAHIGVDPDGRAEVRFGPQAGARGTLAAYDPETGSCVVACHGAGLDGATEPTWALDTGLGCGSCHGTPPEALAGGQPHALSPRCEECHQVDTTTGAPFPPPAPADHGDGEITVLDRVNVAGCEGCHTGSRATVPPFRDAAGDTDPADAQVGAHAAHLTASFVSVGMDCDACHVVPATVGDHPHVDATAGAEVVFGAVATSGGLQPTYEATTGTCSNTWCHGAGIAGGQTVSPSWTNPTNLGCTGCHAMPPDVPAHRTGTGELVDSCGGCHGTVIDDAFNWTNQALHVNGQVDL